ncbi:MAG: hypothetical protein Q8P83_01105 [bacterium]|nr:hypothetical protein [bacterium]
MTPENKPGKIVEGLAGTFKGGRVSGWVERNRQAVGEGDQSRIELDLLDKLCPSFAEATQGLTPEEKIQAAQEALVIADSSPLSATNYEPAFPGSVTLVRKY